MRFTYLFLVLVPMLLAACATPPLNVEGINTTLTPNAAIANVSTARGQRVAWGGMIIHSRNLKDGTEIEVLGYPLESQRPDRNAVPQQRFLVLHNGYLETADYHAGRLVSAVGMIEGTRQGTVGEAPYTYPLLRAEQLHLWPAEPAKSDNNPRFGVGVGIIFGH